MQFGQLTTLSGYLNSECTSAMQKCIRRGLEEEALFWATELDGRVRCLRLEAAPDHRKRGHRPGGSNRLRSGTSSLRQLD